MEITKDLINADSGTIAREAVKILIEKKALNVTLFDVREKSSITDYYVNATGRSASNVAALADEVDEKLTEAGYAPLKVEGRGNGTWELIDFGSVVVHIFSREAREFYKLENLWEDAEKIDITPILDRVDAENSDIAQQQ